MEANDQGKEKQSLINLPEVVVLRPPPLFNFFEDELSKRFHLLKAWESKLDLEEFLATNARSVKAIICSGGGPRISGDILRLIPSLEIVVSTSAGLNHLELAECRRLGVSITNAGDVFSADVADMASCLLIDLLRKVSSADRYVRSGHWTSIWSFPLGSRVGSKRIGIVGLGRIGLQVAKRLEAFGCSISYNSRRKKDFVSYLFYSNVIELAANSDALIICCGLTEQTHHMVNRQVLLALGKKGVIVNIGRGAIINEKDLVQCLVDEEIGGAGLDVFENEPHVPKELLAMDNVVLSPHRAVFTPEAFKDLYQTVIENLEAFFNNKPLLSPVIDE